MKLLLIVFALFSIGDLNAQVTVNEDGKYVSFKLKYATDTTTIDGINWEKENLVSEFTLAGKIPLAYSIKIENDSVAALQKYENRKWVFQEKMEYTGWALSRIVNDTIISEFKIIDFDKDGDEDLVCWVDTNINGNQWSLVYLNDSENKKLIKLWNDADETDIWDRPEYDPVSGNITTERDGSAYGSSEESIFKLDGYKVIPVSRHYQDRTEEIIKDYYYTGNVKWELSEVFEDHTRQIEFKLSEDSIIESINWEKQKLTNEFELAGKKPLKFKILLTSDSEAVLYEFKEKKWIIKDTLGWFETETGYNKDKSFTDSFIITDFNRDGNEDLMCWYRPDINGNQWMVIYLNDPLTGTLIKLKNTAEKDEYSWAAPEFDKLTNTILCDLASDAVRIKYTSSYKLENMTAIPVSKTEYDYNESAQNPNGIMRIFISENGKWKFISEEKLQPSDED